mmetsp:Transcript_2749/g.6426  ORF Transcript_2749/g.6426 Transcript_2749/m.6426 type:complete len:1000 (+) Transcript_2749:317-3316(+)
MAADLAEAVVSGIDIVADPVIRRLQGNGGDGGGPPFSEDDLQFNTGLIAHLTLKRCIARLRTLKSDDQLRKALLPLLLYQQKCAEEEHRDSVTTTDLDETGPFPEDNIDEDQDDSDEDEAEMEKNKRRLDSVDDIFDTMGTTSFGETRDGTSMCAQSYGTSNLPGGGTVEIEIFNDFTEEEDERSMILESITMFGQKTQVHIFLVLVWYIVEYASSTIRAIVLQECQLSEHHAIALAYAIEHCTNLKSINLDQNRKFRHKAIAALSLSVNKCGTVETFVTQDCGFNDAGGYIGRYMIKKNAKMIKIDMSGNKLSAEACAFIGPALAENFCLVHLDLHNNSIGDEGLEHIMNALKQNIVLEKLMVGDNDITSAGGQVIGEALAQNHTLTTLWLQRNRLGNDGVKALAEGLHGDTALRDLRLNMNNLGTEGLIALGQSLSSNNVPLQKLFLQDNLFDGRGVTSFAAAISESETLFELDLSRNKLHDDAGIALGDMLAVNTSLEKLILEGNDIGDVGAIALSEGLKANTTLVNLDLARNAVGDHGAELLGFVLASEKNTSLKTLELNENPIGRKIAKTGWLKRANGRGATGASKKELVIRMDGTQIAKGSLDAFGVKIAKSETVTNFSISMLVFTVLMNWFDLATDVMVVYEFYTSARDGDLSYAWFVFSTLFLILPTMYMMIFMSTPWHSSDNRWLSRLGNALLTLLQVRVASEAYRSWKANETTARFGSIRVVEVAGESGPQAFLQIVFLVYAIGRSSAADVANGTVILSVSLSLIVLGNTFADLFEKEFIMRHSSVSLESSALFWRLIPCLIFHILQFSFRAMTIGLIVSLLDARIAGGIIAGMVLLRVIIWKVTRSERSKFFTVLVTFLANSAWDKRVAAIAGVFVSTVEAAGVMATVWLTPDHILTGDEVQLPYAQGVDFASFNNEVMTGIMAALFFTYNLIFWTYVYHLHEYSDIHFTNANKSSMETIKTAQVYNTVVQDLEAAGRQLRGRMSGKV